MNSNSRPQSRINKYLLQNSTISSRSYDSMNLDKFPDLVSLTQYSTLTFCHNPITSFLTLPTLPDLTTLKLDYTKINSFNGAKKQPQLSSISMVSTPVSNYKYFVEMCLIAFGTQLLKINDKLVSSKQRKFAKDNDNILNKYISSGWLITKGSQPIHLLHFQTRKRICFYTIDKRPNKALDDEITSKDNTNSPISRSSPKSEQASESTQYASSFISNSSDVSSNTANLNNSSYNLDDKKRDALLSKMIQLSREWNPPPKSQTYNKEDFLENSIFELFKPSMARSRRIVSRDQRPENLFKLPVSVQSESPYADEKKPYLLRKREEYELKIKQKQEELRKQQEEQIEYEEEEEEEEIIEQEMIKDENEMQLQDNLQEEKIKDDDITNDTTKLNNNDEEVKESNNETNEKPELKEESIQTEEKEQEEIIKPIILNNKPEIKQIQTKRRSLTTTSRSSKVISTPKEPGRKLISVKTEMNITPPKPTDNYEENNNTPLLSESEKEVYRKRRLMSMNKFILNPNSSKQNPENPDFSRTPIDDKIVKKRRKTLTHAKTIKYIEPPENGINSNNESSTNLTDSNGNITPRSSTKFSRRPTYSEILSSRYQEQHKLSFPSSEQNKKESNIKLQQPSQSATKFSLTQRKTSFASLDLNQTLDTSSKTEPETNKDDIKKETETQFEKEHQKDDENKNEDEKETENKNENKDEDENKNDKDDFNLDQIDEEKDSIDDKINDFLQKQKSEEEEVKSQNKKEEEEEDLDMQMLNEMLEGVNPDEEGDSDFDENDF